MGDTERLVDGLLDRQAALRASVDQLSAEVWSLQMTLAVVVFVAFFSIGWVYFGRQGHE